jgi:hypothetical protein
MSNEAAETNKASVCSNFFAKSGYGGANWLTEDSDLDSDVERLVPTLPKLEQPNLGQTEPEPARAERFHFLSRKSGAWYCNDVCQIVVSGDVS